MNNKIKEQFEMLSRGEQLELLRELNAMVKAENPIIDLSLRCQSRYKENISFMVTVNDAILPPVVAAEIVTPFGNFIAEGSNQKIAKAKVAEVALAAFEELDG